jgi:hypothetical protein
VLYPTPVHLGKGPSTHSTGGWVGCGASLDRFRKSHPNQGLNPECQYYLMKINRLILVNEIKSVNIFVNNCLVLVLPV